ALNASLAFVFVYTIPDEAKAAAVEAITRALCDDAISALPLHQCSSGRVKRPLLPEGRMEMRDPLTLSHNLHLGAAETRFPSLTRISDCAATTRQRAKRARRTIPRPPPSAAGEPIGDFR
ncbi:MAG: hypothetical protein M3022_18275, partial [Actinomycetota bacterium]|nr:hypothetical protein [Actinomycetota bacterium]